MEIRRSKLIYRVSYCEDMDPERHFEGDEEFARSHLKHSKKTILLYIL